MTGFWYLATPYRSHPNGLDAAFDSAVLLTARLIDLGLEIFSPIVYSHVVAKFVLTADQNSHFWLDRQMPMMLASRGIIVGKLPGWKQSSGIRHERHYFREALKPEVFVDPSQQFLHLTEAAE